MKKGGKAKKTAPPMDLTIRKFDLDIMSLADLKLYVSALQKELALMKKDSAFYNINKRRITQFLATMREVNADRKQATIVNHSATDNLIEQMRGFSEKYNEDTIVGDKEKLMKIEEKALQDFVTLNSSVADHKDEERSLKWQIADKDQILESTKFSREGILQSFKETILKKQDSADMKYNEKLGAVQKEGTTCFSARYKDFVDEKLKMMISIWNIPGLSDGVRESYVSETKRMQDFFSAVSSSNLEIVKALKNKFDGLEIEYRKLDSKLQEVRSQNAEMRANMAPRINPGSAYRGSVWISGRTGRIQSEKKLEKLQFRNDVLKEHLRVIQNDFQHLKKQMISAVRKLHLEADFKSHVVEELIKKHIQMESIDPEKEEHEIPRSVSPVYHECWEPNIKKHLRKK